MKYNFYCEIKKNIYLLTLFCKYLKQSIYLCLYKYIIIYDIGVMVHIVILNIFQSQLMLSLYRYL